MKKYKGIKPENFIYYLKEAEFKFNHPASERIALVKRIYFKT
jgi:transposase-like protein